MQVNIRRARADGFPFGLLVKKLRNFEDVEVDGKLYRAADYTELKDVVEFYFGPIFNTNASAESVQFLENEDGYQQNGCKAVIIGASQKQGPMQVRLLPIPQDSHKVYCEQNRWFSFDD